MGFFSRFENKMEDAIDGIGDKLFDSPISPVQIAKKAEKQMRRNKMLGAGKQFAPTLYTVLVNANDDARLFGYYPTLAGETETYLKAKANEAGLAMDGDPLVRFIVDNDLKSGKFDVIAEPVAGDIITQLRAEENERYGINNQQAQPAQPQAPAQPAPQQKMSSAFATEEELAQSAAQQQNAQNQQPQPAVQQAPAPQPQQVPQQAPAPEPTVAPQSVPAPEPVIAQESNQASSEQNNQAPAPQATAAPNQPTAVFAGNFDSVNQKTQTANPAIPQASLRDNATGQSYALTSATCVIGRESTCNIVLTDANASRQHAQVCYNQGMWLVNDLGSTNGTFVNNQEITTREIKNGDVITIGVTHMTFMLN